MVWDSQLREYVAQLEERVNALENQVGLMLAWQSDALNLLEDMSLSVPQNSRLNRLADLLQVIRDLTLTGQKEIK